MVYQLLVSGCQTKYSLVSFLTLIGGVLEDGGALTCQDDIKKLVNISFYEDYGKYTPFWKKIKEGTSGEFADLYVQRFSETILQSLIHANQPGHTISYPVPSDIKL